jgi:hypothetical protein
MRTNVTKAGAWLGSIALLVLSASCVQILGDLKPEGTGGATTGSTTTGSTTSGSQTSTSGSTTSSSSGGSSSGGTGGIGGGATSSSSSSSSSSGVPPVVGRPGSDLTSGGLVSTSASYRLVGAVSEGPGQNGSSSSPSHKVVTGIIGTTQ